MGYIVLGCALQAWLADSASCVTLLQMVRAAGGVCIADEVQTGFGRTGTSYWGFQNQVAPFEQTSLGLINCNSRACFLLCLMVSWSDMKVRPKHWGLWVSIHAPRKLHTMLLDLNILPEVLSFIPVQGGRYLDMSCENTEGIRAGMITASMYLVRISCWQMQSQMAHKP